MTRLKQQTWAHDKAIQASSTYPIPSPCFCAAFHAGMPCTHCSLGVGLFCLSLASTLGRFWRYLNIEEEMVRLLPQLYHAIDEQEEREERARGAKEEYKPCYSSSSSATRILRA
jgi:hypothetical protein